MDINITVENINTSVNEPKLINSSIGKVPALVKNIKDYTYEVLEVPTNKLVAQLTKLKVPQSNKNLKDSRLKILDVPNNVKDTELATHIGELDINKLQAAIVTPKLNKLEPAILNHAIINTI